MKVKHVRSEYRPLDDRPASTAQKDTVDIETIDGLLSEVDKISLDHVVATSASARGIHTAIVTECYHVPSNLTLLLLRSRSTESNARWMTNYSNPHKYYVDEISYFANNKQHLKTQSNKHLLYLLRRGDKSKIDQLNSRLFENNKQDRVVDINHRSFGYLEMSDRDVDQLFRNTNTDLPIRSTLDARVIFERVWAGIKNRKHIYVHIKNDKTGEVQRVELPLDNGYKGNQIAVDSNEKSNTHSQYDTDDCFHRLPPFPLPSISRVEQICTNSKWILVLLQGGEATAGQGQTNTVHWSLAVIALESRRWRIAEYYRFDNEGTREDEAVYTVIKMPYGLIYFFLGLKRKRVRLILYSRKGKKMTFKHAQSQLLILNSKLLKGSYRKATCKYCRSHWYTIHGRTADLYLELIESDNHGVTNLSKLSKIRIVG